jgi:hypothetical protein
MVHLMTILHAFLAMPSCITATMFSENPHQIPGRYPPAMGLGVLLLKEK